MPTTSGLTDTPVTLALLLTTIVSSIAASILDIKHLLPIRPHPHIFPYLQLSRLLTFQVAYTNSSELLVSVVLLYQLRILERIWGSRKYASFIACVYGILALLVPGLVGTLSLLTGGWYDYMPAGPTGLVLAALACWREEVPALVRWKIVTSTNNATRGGSRDEGITLSDKFTIYIMAAQLSLSQFPYTIVPAGVGSMVGLAWRGDLLPGGMGRWRVPAWFVGESRRSKNEERERYAGLRRRLEEEGSTGDGMRAATSSASAVGSGGVDEGDGARRRGVSGMVREYFRGVF